MTSTVNTTMKKFEECYKDEKIEDIYDLNFLKKYACPKNQHKKDWYCECVDCPSRKTCRAGKQAYFIMNNVTAPNTDSSQIAVDIQEKKKRDAIEDIFRQPDPLKVLLETSGNVKPQSIYQRVNLWRKSYPDLEEKYHMMEKVRILWNKPYDRMRVPDVLKMMYPDSVPKEEPKPVISVDTASMHPSSIVAEKPLARYSVKPFMPEKKEEKAMSKDDEVSLEEFLSENDISEEEEELKAPLDPVKQSSPKAKAPSSEASKMQDMLVKLENEKKHHLQKIQELDKQIEAIHTVQKLIG